ncbi:Electron transport complex subunit RnfG [BD1-7 clade bacterium]|uniref:Ion-translocating oxidoreductase complex subunit G n=1 Tax=BD1-7 clade bacterium TaxID=2029982 RepID=A0A5S9P9R6_9GAMM|nr:Electron transport complex subunit RnfG [BD1-7 clade bacterium]CAA0108109.1 Electron transport complex subunit RnfG [BD1-7 clade bacterium]CAA0108123.1 Electron transport complex subunit RnfG [BD1-7 clade bacterium]
MIGKAITKNSIMLGIFAVVVAASLAATELYTRDLREAAIRKVKSKALEEVVSPKLRDNVLLDSAITVDDQKYLKLKDPASIYVARKNGDITAFIIPTRAPDGYGGAINTIVGVNLNGDITGVRVITHKETPGLGDKVETKKSDWVYEFNGRSLTNPEADGWAVKKDRGIYDQFTGATITPRAVVGSVHNALLFYKANKSELLKKAQLSVDADQTPAES